MNSVCPTIKVSVAVICCIGLLFGCQSEPERFIPDVSSIEVNTNIKRFERELFGIDTTRTAAEIERLRAAYPEFSGIYFDRILGIENPEVAPDGPERYLNGFVNHPATRRLYDTTQIVFADFSHYEQEFERAFKFLKYYFPELPTPEVTTFISEYSFQNFVFGENSVAVGLDFFLGPDYPYLAYYPNNPNFSEYLSRNFRPEFVVPKTLYAYVDDLVGPPGGARLLDHMVHNGKKRYLLQRLLPEATNEQIFEFTTEQIEWLRANESQLWGYLVDGQHLYSTDYADFRKLIEYSPTGNGDMPPETPGRSANFIGYRIVDAYMRRFPETTLPELVGLKDAQAILQEGRYKPRR